MTTPFDPELPGVASRLLARHHRGVPYPAAAPDEARLLRLTAARRIWSRLSEPERTHLLLAL